MRHGLKCSGGARGGGGDVDGAGQQVRTHSEDASFCTEQQLTS